MKPALAFPYNDPDGTMLPHIQAILLDLKNHFILKTNDTGEKIGHEWGAGE